MKITGGLIGIVIGVLIIWKTFPLVNMFGKISWAEQHLGSGGTYTLYKLVGLLVVLLSAMHLFGILDIFLSPFESVFGGLAPKQ